MIVFGQCNCNHAEKVVVWAKVVLIGQKWLYLGKSGCIWAKWLYSGKCASIREIWL